VSDVACLTYRVAGSTWASPVGSVREVLPAQPLTAVAGAPAAVAGLVAVRGAALCVLDARVLLGLAADERAAGPVVVVGLDDGAVGVAVDELVDVELLPVESLVPAEERSAVLGAVDHRGRVVRVVDVARAAELAVDLERAADLDEPRQAVR
jgi:purine-binding chemotaxis protein CheW